MGRLLFISALIHVVLLILLPLVPGLARDYDSALDVYAVELLDVTERAPTPVSAPVEEPETEVSEPEAPEPVVEEVEKEPPIPDDPTPAPKRVVLKPPAREKEPSLEERLAQRLREQDQSRPEPTAQPQRREESPAVQTGSARVTAARFPYSWYLSVVQGKVSSNWSQPSARLIVEDSLTVSVSFVIRRDGSVGDVRIARSSGR
ncbi:MAG: TonB C-terminal domain-containing protein, partial [Candidatus Eisenbacteria bacterium]